MLKTLRERVPPTVFPVALFALATLWVAYWSLHVHALTIFDERLAVEGGRWLSAHPGSLTEVGGYWPRGIERMTAVLWWPFTALSSGARQFELSHLLYALIYGATAFPVWGFARGLSLSVGWATLATATCMFVPWAVFATVFLNSAIATTLVLFILWLGWRSALRPDWRLDLVAVLALGALALTRVSYAAFGAVWVLVLAVPALRDAIRGDGIRDVPRGVARAARTHPVAAVVAFAGMLGVLAVAASGFGGVAGADYGARPLNWHSFSEHVTVSAAQLAAATAIVPLIIGGAWLCVTSVRAKDDACAVFAVAALASLLALMLVNTAGGFDERYQGPAIVLILVGFFAALARRELRPAPILVVAIGVWWAMSQHAIAVPGQADAVFYAPGQQVFSRVIVDDFAGKLFSDPVAVLACVLVATLVAVGLALRADRMPAARIAVGVAVAIYCAAGSAYVMRHFTDGQRPRASFAALTFADEAVGSQVARPLAEAAGANGPLFDELRYFNANVAATLGAAGAPGPGAGQSVEIDSRTGRVSPATPLPRFLVTSSEFLSAGLATGTAASSSAFDLPLFVERVLARQATYVALDPAPGGLVESGRRLRLRVFARGARAVTPDLGCLITDVTVPGGAPVRHQTRLAPRLRGRSSAIVGFRGPVRLARTVVGPCS